MFSLLWRFNPLNFNPRFPRGKRPPDCYNVDRFYNFNPRFPRGKRLYRDSHPARPGISIHASRGGSDLLYCVHQGCPLISIHASRGGSDRPVLRRGDGKVDFNPRFPRGKRPLINSGSRQSTQFQSTLPAGEATLSYLRVDSGQVEFQSTLPAGEATSSFFRLYPSQSKFQSTLPAGEATFAVLSVGSMVLFQSTLPAGEATINSANSVAILVISIHASRGGSDTTAKTWGNKAIEISIHASRGGSDYKDLEHLNAPYEFQSTLPAGEATWIEYDAVSADADFNPRFPRGKRPTTY